MDRHASVFQHCVGVHEVDGFLQPVRFSDDRLEYYRHNRPECCYSQCTVGVSMEFFTDAEEISFDYRMTTVFYPVEVFDIYENDLFMCSAKQPDGALEGTVTYRKVNSGRTKITIYFPIGVVVTVGNFRFGDFEPVDNSGKRRLMIVGDSISQGLFGYNPSVCYTTLLANFYDMDYLNLSIGGETFRAGLLDPQIAYHPDRILFSLGTNDVYFLHDYEIITRNIDAFFTEFREMYPDIPADIVSPFWQTVFDRTSKQSIEAEELTRRVTDYLQSRAAVFNYKLHDGMYLMPHASDFFSDHCHPNDKGFANLALRLIKSLDW